MNLTTELLNELVLFPSIPPTIQLLHRNGFNKSYYSQKMFYFLNICLVTLSKKALKNSRRDS